MRFRLPKNIITNPRLILMAMVLSMLLLYNSNDKSGKKIYYEVSVLKRDEPDGNDGKKGEEEGKKNNDNDDDDDDRNNESSNFNIEKDDLNNITSNFTDVNIDNNTTKTNDFNGNINNDINNAKINNSNINNNNSSDNIDIEHNNNNNNINISAENANVINNIIPTNDDIENCHFKFPTKQQRQQKHHQLESPWQFVKIKSHSIYLFSAYLSKSSIIGDVIVIYVISDTTHLRLKSCLLWSDGNDDDDDDDDDDGRMVGTLVDASVEFNYNVFKKTYREHKIICHLVKKSNVSNSKYVSLVGKDCQQPDNAMKIVKITNETRPQNLRNPQYPWKFPKVNFSICVSPLNKRYNNSKWLIEWMELNQILGVEYFYFYNYSIGSEVERVLDYYIKRNLATVIPWKLPIPVNESTDESDIHYYGQLTALNDCATRSRMMSHFALNIDLDEFIVPTNRSTLYRLMTDIFKNDTLDISVISPTIISVRNTFFKWVPCQSNVAGFDLFTFCSVMREKYIYVHKQRSKMIFNPGVIDLFGVHSPALFYRVTKLRQIEPELALVYHYYRQNWNTEKILDTRMHLYSDELSERVGRVEAALAELRL